MRQHPRPGHPLRPELAAGLEGGARCPARLPADRDVDCAMSEHGTILVVDDEEIMREILEALLTREGYQVRLAAPAPRGSSSPGRRRSMRRSSTSCCPGSTASRTLEELKKLDEDLPVIMITAFASVETAITAMKRGAFDYITKPFKNDEVLVVLRNAVERSRLVNENKVAQAEPAGRHGPLRQHHRPKPEDAAGIRSRDPDRAEPLHDPGLRGERHRQGTRGARAPHQFAARRPGVCDRELRQPAAGPSGIEPLRARQGGVHGRRVSEEGAVRDRRQGQHLLRRDRQRPARDAGASSSA